MLRLFSKEFDADQLSRSPNNCAIMSGAVSSDQQCKLCRKLGRVAYLQRGTGFGLVTNEAGNREPAEVQCVLVSNRFDPSIL